MPFEATKPLNQSKIKHQYCSAPKATNKQIKKKNKKRLVRIVHTAFLVQKNAHG